MNSISAFLLIVNVFNVVLKINTQSCGYLTYSDGNTCQKCGLYPNDHASRQAILQSTKGTVKYLKAMYSNVVRIKYQDQYICSGTLISERTVLTAASCIFNDPNPANYKVTYGLELKLDEIESSLVQKMIIHKNYNNVNKLNDIALLILPDKVTLSQFVGVVCLPNSQQPFPIYYDTSMIGGGWIKNTVPTLQITIYQTIRDPSKSCKASIFKNASLLTDFKTQLCATSDLAKWSSCDLEVGGPILNTEYDKIPEQNRIVVGIKSYDVGNCSTDPTIYTNVRSFYDWIISNIVN